MILRYEAIAAMIDHALLHPTVTDADLRDGCELAMRHSVASVCVKPSSVTQAAAILEGSTVAVGTVVGFPHGANATSVKCGEAALACREGAAEIDFVINIGKALSGEWRYVEEEVRAVCAEAHSHRALVKVIFETAFLQEDSDKVRLCEISEAAAADFVKTCTGFDFRRDGSGSFVTLGATEHDVRLMRAAYSTRVGVKASGGIRNHATLLKMWNLGATRFGTSATEQILEEARTYELGSSRAETTVCGGEY